MSRGRRSQIPRQLHLTLNDVHFTFSPAEIGKGAAQMYLHPENPNRKKVHELAETLHGLPYQTLMALFLLLENATLTPEFFDTKPDIKAEIRQIVKKPEHIISTVGGREQIPEVPATPYFYQDSNGSGGGISLPKNAEVAVGTKIRLPDGTIHKIQSIRTDGLGEGIGIQTLHLR